MMCQCVICGVKSLFDLTACLEQAGGAVRVRQDQSKLDVPGPQQRRSGDANHKNTRTRTVTRDVVNRSHNASVCVPPVPTNC